jgi:hypothetical protein
LAVDAWPAAVDPKIAAPNEARAVAVGSDGRLLLAVTAFHPRPAPRGHLRVHLARSDRPAVPIEDARAVGFMPDGAALYLPDDRPSDAGPRAGALADVGRCGFFRKQSL